VNHRVGLSVSEKLKYFAHARNRTAVGPARRLMMIIISKFLETSS